MPSTTSFVVALRGDDTYRRYLDRLSQAVRESGVQIGEGPHALAEYALVVLGLQHGLIAPRRCRPRGTNRYGEPRQT